MECADLIVTNARLLDGAGPVDIVVAGGRIDSVGPADPHQPASRRIDAKGGLVTPSFVEPHFHLDKALCRDVPGCATESWAEAPAAEIARKRSSTSADVEARACEALRLAAAHGIGRMRAHADVDQHQKLAGLEGVMRARERFSDKIEIEIVAFAGEAFEVDPDLPDLLAEAMEMGADIVGGIPNFEHSADARRHHVDTIFAIAAKSGARVDCHADYNVDVREKMLEMVADRTIAEGRHGDVLASHCCALAAYPDDEAARVIDKVKTADITIAISPIANLQQAGEVGRLPIHRGSSRAKELLDAGVNVVAGTDNMKDMWYRFARLDPLETALVAILSAGLRTDGEILAGLEMVTTRAARALGAPDRGIAPGEPADFVIFEATNLTDLLRMLPMRRTVLKGGRVVGGIDARSWG